MYRFFTQSIKPKKRKKMGIFEIIMAVFSAIVGAVGVGLTAKANKENVENQQEMLEQQQQFAIESANRANDETRAQYKDMYSPGALVEQYEEAGLSPTLIYANGASVTGANTAAQAHSSNLGAPMINPAVSNNFNQLTEMMKGMRESERQKSETQKNEQYVLNLQNEIDVNNAKIEEILSQKNLNESTEKLNNVRTQLEAFNSIGKSIENEVAAATKQDKIKIVSQGLENMKKEFDKLQKEIDLLEIDKETRSELNNAIINNYKAQTALYWQEEAKTYCDSWLAVSQIYVNEAQMKKNYSEAAKMDAEIKQINYYKNQIEANIKYLDSLKNKTDAETQLIIKQKTTEIIGWIAKIQGIMKTRQEMFSNGLDIAKDMASMAQ